MVSWQSKQKVNKMTKEKECQLQNLVLGPLGKREEVRLAAAKFVESQKLLSRAMDEHVIVVKVGHLCYLVDRTEEDVTCDVIQIIGAT